MVWITLPAIYIDKFCILSWTPCALITDLILGNSGFGNLVKLLNLPWPLNVMIIFYTFACKATKLKFLSSPFCIGMNMKSGV